MRRTTQQLLHMSNAMGDFKTKDSIPPPPLNRKYTEYFRRKPDSDCAEPLQTVWRWNSMGSVKERDEQAWGSPERRQGRRHGAGPGEGDAGWGGGGGHRQLRLKGSGLGRGERCPAEGENARLRGASGCGDLRLCGRSPYATLSPSSLSSPARLTDRPSPPAATGPRQPVLTQCGGKAAGEPCPGRAVQLLPHSDPSAAPRGR